MKNFKVIVFLIAVLAVIPFSLRSQVNVSGDDLYIDQEFYNEFIKTLPIFKDDTFESKINSIIHCRGTITTITKDGRYRKNFRIILHDEEAEKMNITLYYYVFFDSKETYAIVTKDTGFELTGQLMSYTPLNVKRDNYILDIVLEKGSIVFNK